MVNLFGCAAGKPQVDSTTVVESPRNLGRDTVASRRLQNSQKTNSKNLFAQRLKRGAVKAGQTRRRRQGGDSYWPGQVQVAQPSAYGQPQYSPVATSDRAGNYASFGGLQQQADQAPVNGQNPYYQPSTNDQIPNDQASGSNPSNGNGNINVAFGAPNGYNNPQRSADSYSKKK